METTQKSPPLGRSSDRFFDLLELFLGQLWKLLQPVHSPNPLRQPPITAWIFIFRVSALNGLTM